MLIESIVRKTLGLKRHCVKNAIESGGEIVIYLEIDRRCKSICSSCKRKCPGYDKLKERRWKHVPMWGFSVTLVYTPRRVKCTDCGIRVEEMPWTKGKSPISLPLTVVLATWARILAWNVVGQIYGFHWNTVRKAVKDVVDYGLENRDLSDLLYLGVDEISRKKGHVYHTQVYDLMEKTLIWSGEDRTSETLKEFFDYLGEDNCKSIEAVCCDMWAPYVDAIKENLPNALLVFDKFHIIRHLLNAVDDVRKEEAKKLDLELLKKTRYIWLKNPWNLTEIQKTKLSDLEKLNLKITREI